MTRSQLITGIWRDRYHYSDTQRRIDEEQAAKIITDDSVDHKRYMVYIYSIKRETEKAILAKVGHRRGGRQMDAWLPKSKVEFLNQHDALIPVEQEEISISTLPFTARKEDSGK